MGFLQKGTASAEAEEVTDLAQLLAAAKLPPHTVAALTQQVLALGAVHVQELSRDDWAQLPAWPSMKEMERRRVLQYVEK